MAKRRTYEQKLFDDLLKLEPNRWYRIDNRPDCEKMSTAVKIFIDNGEPFIFSNDFTKLKRESDTQPLQKFRQMKELPPGVTIIHHQRGEEQEISVKGRTYLCESPNYYEIKLNGKTIAIEV